MTTSDELRAAGILFAKLGAGFCDLASARDAGDGTRAQEVVKEIIQCLGACVQVTVAFGEADDNFYQAMTEATQRFVDEFGPNADLRRLAEAVVQFMNGDVERGADVAGVLIAHLAFLGVSDERIREIAMNQPAAEQAVKAAREWAARGQTLPIEQLAEFEEGELSPTTEAAENGVQA